MTRNGHSCASAATKLHVIFKSGSADLLKPSPATTCPGFVGNRAAIAGGTAGADVFPFQADRLHRLTAPAFARVFPAPLAGAVLSTPAENPNGFLNGQQVHRGKLRPAPAFSRLCRNIVAGAIIIAVADVIHLAAVRRDDNANGNKQEENTQSCCGRSFHFPKPPGDRHNHIIVDSRLEIRLPRERGRPGRIRPIHFRSLMLAALFSIIPDSEIGNI